MSEKEGESLQRTESGRRMATSSSGGGGPSCVLVAGPGGEDITSPIFGVKDAPTLALADTLAAARVSHAASTTIDNHNRPLHSFPRACSFVA